MVGIYDTIHAMDENYGDSMIDFDKTCAVCGGMVGDYGPKHGWMHIVSQYDNAPHDVVLSSDPTVGSPEDKSGDKQQDHLPECEAYRSECGGGCICAHLRACEQRVQERYSTYLNADDEGSYSAGYRDGYEFARHTLLTPMQAEQFDAMMEALDNE